MEDTELPSPQKEVMESWIDERGFWSNVFDELLFVRPEYIQRYLNLSTHPSEALDDKVKELIHIAINASTTHLYHRGTRTHIRNALKKGVTVEEITDALILASTVGIHTSTMGAKLLLKQENRQQDVEFDEKFAQEIEAKLGYWTEFIEKLAKRDIEHLSHYAELCSIVKELDVLDEKVQHLILLAVEIAPTRLNEEAALLHMNNAFNEGASDEEIMAVVETASVIGVHTMDAMPILIEEAARQSKLPEEFQGHEEFVTFRDPHY